MSESAAELTALTHWGLVGDLTVDRTVLGTMNDVFIVGRGSPEFVLCGHRHTDRRRIELEHDVMDTARKAGVPAPRSVLTQEAQRFAYIDGRYWSLLEWLPGEHGSRSAFTELQATSMGETLAFVHSSLAALPLAAAEARSNETTDATVDRIDRLIQVIERLPVVEHDDRLARRWLRAQREWLVDRIDEDVAPSHDTQVIHGDYHDANVLFCGDDVVGVIDWDKAGTRSAGEEVIRCAHLSFGLDGEMSRAFFKGYRRRRSLTDDELDSAAIRYGYERDRSIWVFDELYTKGNERVRPVINERPFTPFEASWCELRAHV